MPRGSLQLLPLAGALLAGCGDGSGPSPAGEALLVTAAADYACALDQHGQVWCWGAGALGQLGNGDTLNSRNPLPIAGGLDIATVSAGDFHACALTRTGAAWCWGTNFTGVIGIGTAGGLEPRPREVAGGLRFGSLSAGAAHTCALELDGKAWCWGQGNNGRLGSADTLDHFAPYPVQTALHFTAISAGSAHTCAVTAGNQAFCWGSNFRGQLGVGDTLDALVPTAVMGGSQFMAVEAGGYHSCGLVLTGEALCWGNDVTAELGDGRLVPEAIVVPVAVSGGRQFRTLAVGNYHACAITPQGAGWCWGQSVYGKLGNNTYFPTPVPVAVAGAHHFRGIAAASNHTCAAARDGHLFCWGRNSLGQLGTGQRGDAFAPVEVAPLGP